MTSPSAALIAARLQEPAFTLIDVGCSGGLAKGWEVFGDKLRAFGFDPVIEEINRLRAQEHRPHVSYRAGFVGLPIDHPLRARYQILKSSWPRLSAAQAQAYASGQAPSDLTTITEWREEYIPAFEGPMFGAEDLPGKASDAAQTGDPGSSINGGSGVASISEALEANRWRDAGLADEAGPLVLSDFVANNGLFDIDFIKIDVDGMDYTILYDLAPVWNRCGVLGVLLEVNFEGSYSPHHHTFHNTDRYMRRHGFDLFGLTTRNYSSGALPSPFLYRYPAQSLHGRPLQGDALYLRDFAWRSPETDPDNFSTEKLARLIALFCIFDLHDQAAETALRFRERLSALLNVDNLLDCLASEVQGRPHKAGAYADYMARFSRNAPEFYNAAWRG